MILSTKLIATMLVLFSAAFLIDSIKASHNDDDDDSDSIASKRISETEASRFLDIYRRLLGGKDEEIREDNNELGEKRAEAFEAYEEKCEPTFHLGVEDTAADSLLLTRELATEFNRNVDDNDGDGQGSLFKVLVRRKLDAEEIKEINLKKEYRRRKAFQNYEEACKIKGKFKERSCPKLSDCYAKNKLPFVPLATQTTALAVTSTALSLKTTASTAKPKVGRELFLREWANTFLERDQEDEVDDDDDDDNDETNESSISKRSLFKSKPSEIQEESNERRNKAFKKYEEYCEKRAFRIGGERNCPALNKKLC